MSAFGNCIYVSLKTIVLFVFIGSCGVYQNSVSIAVKAPIIQKEQNLFSSSLTTAETTENACYALIVHADNNDSTSDYKWGAATELNIWTYQTASEIMKITLNVGLDLPYSFWHIKITNKAFCDLEESLKKEAFLTTVNEFTGDFKIQSKLSKKVVYSQDFEDTVINLEAPDSEDPYSSNVKTVCNTPFRGDGTILSPKLICTANELQAINVKLVWRYELAADIDLNGVSFTPIGQVNAPFTGSFNGKNFTIYNFNMDSNAEVIRSNEDDFGLFGFVGNSSSFVKIENLKIRNAIISGGVHLGTLVAWIKGLGNVEIYNCHVFNSKIDTDNQHVGGLIGYAEGNVVIARSSASESRISGFGVVGGLVGYINKVNDKSPQIEESFSTTYSINGFAQLNTAGGLVGQCENASISNSYTHVIDSQDTVNNLTGSIIGNFATGAPNCTISNSYGVHPGHTLDRENIRDPSFINSPLYSPLWKDELEDSYRRLAWEW